MNTGAAEKAAGLPAEKEKMEKRRALGRGLESLLPGPRAVPGIRAAAPVAATAELGSAGQPGAAVPTSLPVSPPFAKDAKDGAASVSVRGDSPEGEAFDGVIRAVVEEGEVEQQVPFDPAQGKPHGLKPVRNDNVEGEAGAELGAAGQPRAAVPTWPQDSAQDRPAGAVPASPETDGERFDGVIRAEVEEAVEQIPGGSGSSAEQQVPHRRFAPVRNDIGENEGITIFAQAESRMPGNLVVNLAVGNIDKNPFQTRYVHHDDAMQELAESIKANGVVQPIVVRPAQKEGRYILILGERRLTASRMLGRETIPAIVRRVSEQQAAEMTIVENLQREDLSPLEQAEAFRVLSEEFMMTQGQIGERIGLSRESVANYMRLLRLPEETMKLLADGSISFATAKELLKIEDKDLIAKTAKYVVEHGLTFDQVEKLVWRTIGVLAPVPGMPGQEKKKGGARWVDPNVRAAQTELERLLGVRVRIRDRKGKGKIVIEYATVDDYERVVTMLRGKRG